MTSVSAGHIILTTTQPVGSGWPQRGSNPGSPHQGSRALPTELPRPPPPPPPPVTMILIIRMMRQKVMLLLMIMRLMLMVKLIIIIMMMMMMMMMMMTMIELVRVITMLSMIMVRLLKMFVMLIIIMIMMIMRKMMMMMMMMMFCLFVWFLNVLVNYKVISRTSPTTERLTILRAATHETELGDHDFVSAGHIILTPTQPVGSGRPQRKSNPGTPHQESHALPTKLSRRR